MRLRQKNAVSTKVCSVAHMVFDRVSGCTATAAWRQFLTASLPYSQGQLILMSDVETPSFRKVQKSGGVIFNPMQRLQVDIVEGLASKPIHYRQLAEICTGSSSYSPYQPAFQLVPSGGNFAMGLVGTVFPSEISFVSSLTASELQRLRVEASTQCEANRGQVSPSQWENLAEIRQSLGLLSSALTAFQRAFYAFRKSRPDLFVKEASGIYLLARYGLMPTIRGIADALEGLRKATGRKRITARGQAFISKTTSSIIIPSHTYYKTLRISSESNESVSCRAMSLDEVEVTLSDNLGFDLKGLASLPFELITLSFVADWFFTISDYIQALVPLVGGHNLGACYTIEHTRHESFALTEMVLPSTHSVDVPPSGSFTRRTVYKARVPGALPPPRIVMKTNFGFSSMLRVADAFSLLAQRLLR